jgi:hypothetical protein
MNPIIKINTLNGIIVINLLSINCALTNEETKELIVYLATGDTISSKFSEITTLRTEINNLYTKLRKIGNLPANIEYVE